MHIALPKLSLVVLIGPSGTGKSTFARRHFLPSEILSSDYCRGLVSDDENCQAATNDAFEILHFVATKRLSRGRLTVIDATNVQRESRAPLVTLARKFHCLPVAIVLNLPESVCHERNQSRSDRAFGPHVVRQQHLQLRRSIRALGKEGFRHIFVLDSLQKIDQATIERVPLWNDRCHDHGPFDFIGDVHGCADELEELLAKLGYKCAPSNSGLGLGDGTGFVHPAGRKAVFVGDLVDRGPRILDTLRIVYNMVQSGSALCVPGNHDEKLVRKLSGRDVKRTHGLANTLAEIEALPDDLRESFCHTLKTFLDKLVSHYVLDDGRIVVAHAGMKAEMQGRGSGAVRSFALYGETTGETDEFGLPVRLNWASEYRGDAMVVYGHTPVFEAEWLNRTINIDTGCVFGGKLTALRYPERELVSVRARQTYCEPSRPLSPRELSAHPLSTQQQQDDMLDLEDVSGKRIVTTQLMQNLTIRAENASAALEVMSRFAANPKWLIYLPPTMSPTETSTMPGLLEHPAEALSYFRNQGIPQVICQEKHMGSRAVVIVCQDEAAARARFGIAEAESGIIYTRTGRRFFTDLNLESQLLERLRGALGAAHFWERFHTTWVCFDCELMPWSAKAQELLRSQYAAVGASGQGAFPPVTQAFEQAAARLQADSRQTLMEVADAMATHRHNLDRFVEAYRNYCWPVQSLEDLKLAPFHLLATEGKVHTEQNHLWHMETLHELCDQAPSLLRKTRYATFDVTDPDSERLATAWWEELTGTGGEGMVVKPVDFVMRGTKGLVQPAVKCRGREYLRIIYGPNYTADANLARLRKRSVGTKRSLALREFALGHEALHRFVRYEPLRRVHEAVFGVLALESEPVDPRL
ncbi:polynucleotide kinase-phosphatase [Schlesneria paludicola]|uniref:polynucleotide kinase-phosphatase n=1 Tax=Schlesneria paludicola TaxID=360056 RepID=UPI00029B24FD|nr:polynucleotide kinase-phosphatase [Schlesneria paludicola]